MVQNTIAVFGLGSMGFGMACSLLRAGHVVHGFDIDPNTVARFQSEGGIAGDLTAADQFDAAIIVVLNAAQTETVLFDQPGLVAKMRPGSVIVASATVAPDFARDMAQRCFAQDVQYLDAPISGGSLKAASGDLTIMASGTAAAFAVAKPALDAMAQTVFPLGDAAGAGSAMKAVNQLLAGVHIAAMAEAMTFGMTQGVRPEDFVDVISKCAGTSWMLENRAPHIVAGDYAPHSSVNIWPKDLGIVLDIAKTVGFDAPITQQALSQYKKAVDAGLGGQDDAAVAKVYARQAGLTLPGED